MHFQQLMHRTGVYKRLLKFAVVVALVGLSACGGSDKQTAANRADWLRNYVSTHSIQRGWVVTDIYVGKGSKIVMDISVPRSKIMAMNSLSRMQQVAVVKRLCPAGGSGVRRVFSDKSRLWIYLNGRKGRIIGGSCRYNSQS